MKVCSLCSGSKGNCTFIDIDGTKLLIDAGMSCKYITSSLNQIGVNIAEIDYVFITHSHSDHVSSLKQVLKCSRAKFCTSKLLLRSLKDDFINEDIVFFEEVYISDNFKVKALNSSHDAIDSKNYVIESGGKKVSIITDTGYVKQKYFSDYYNSDIILMESNHDIEMLNESSYPNYLKKRIYGDDGHLSNAQAGFYLTKLIGPKTEVVLLIHLSDENNDPTLALNTVQSVLDDYSINFSNIQIAEQKVVSEVYNID